MFCIIVSATTNVAVSPGCRPDTFFGVPEPYLRRSGHDKTLFSNRASYHSSSICVFFHINFNILVLGRENVG